MRAFFHLASVSLFVVANVADARPAAPEDVIKEVDVRSPDISPSGDAVVYQVSTTDAVNDSNESHVWISKWDGSGERQLTGREGESESSPKFSPDGKQVAFISSRADEDEESRLWLLPMDGGEAQAVTNIEGSVEDFAWSPSGKFLALIVSDKQPEPKKDAKGEEIPPPIVIDRYHFKVDGVGYLGKERSRLFLYDIAKGTAARLTDGNYDESLPSWSPNSTSIAFVSRRTADPDRTPNYDIFIARADKLGAKPTQLTKYEGNDSGDDFNSYPAWSPDGKQIAYVRGGDPKLIWYAASDLAVIPSTGGEPTILTKGMDRNVYNPVFTPDGKVIDFVVENDGRQELASVSASGGPVSKVISGEFVISSPTMAKDGRIALLKSSPTMPYEVFALDGGKLRALSSRNAEWMKGIDFSMPKFTSYKSKDGTEVHGFVMLPPGTPMGKKLPTMLHPHGGPASQYDYMFDMWQQVFAGAGYVVLTPNPRGSTGRGTEYSAGINAAWGSVDVEDDLAAVDDAVARGIADPDKLVVGGWSYGGMSTNYLIASDTRFKAAMAGASIGNIFAGYGTDMYVLEYDYELGVPWKNLDVWIKNSYPFLHADRIKTPTLYMVGGADINVPTWASEQMYQALKTIGIDTELVIYPGEYHSFERPSYRVDRMQRWLKWYADHLK